MLDVEDFFRMSNKELLASWYKAKLEEWDARVADGKADPELRASEEAKLTSQVIRLVISFRLMRVDDEPEG